MAAEVGDILSYSGFPHRIANEIIAVRKGGTTNAVRLASMGLSYPLAIELAAQLTSGIYNPNPLMALGMSGAEVMGLAAVAALTPALPALSTPQLLDAMDSLTLNQAGGASTTTGVGTGSIALSATYKKQGTNAIRAVPTGFGSSMSLTKTNVKTADPATLGTVACYVYSEQAYRALGNVQIQLGRGGTYYQDATGGIRSDSAYGGRWVARHVSELKNGGVAIKDAALGSGQIDVRFAATLSPITTAVPNVDIMMSNCEGRPTEIWVWDDGVKSQYNLAFPLSQTYRIKNSMAPQMNFVEAGNVAQISKANMIEMVSSGLWTVNVDGTLDDTDMTAAANLAAAITNINSVRTWTNGIGLAQDPDNANFVIYPFGIGERSNGIVKAAVGYTTGSNVATVADTSNLVVGQAIESFGLATSGIIPYAQIGSITTNTSVTMVAADGTTPVNATGAGSSWSTRFIFKDDTNAPFYGAKLGNALKAAGYKAARTTGAQFPDNVMYSRYGVGDQDMMLPAYGVSASTTLQNLRDIRALAKIRGGTVIFFIHDLIASGTPTGNQVLASTIETIWQETRADLDAGLTTNLSFKEWWDRDCANPATVPF